ncbi:hypothetical protein LOD99_9135 [Oopsacas minuta]|uniref:Uncharacterized protein n=1 Tax=Oopsacas minuta TaxID=111878 RepID=A0AAV7JDR9_9METZ|nr:hypothetical protein LOD99_9135 [Oopsacas minuta]
MSNTIGCTSTEIEFSNTDESDTSDNESENPVVGNICVICLMPRTTTWAFLLFIGFYFFKVCIHHFHEGDVEKTIQFFDGMKMIKTERKKVALKKYAVPSIFPNCPSYLTDPLAHYLVVGTLRKAKAAFSYGATILYYTIIGKVKTLQIPSYVYWSEGLSVGVLTSH